MNMKQKENLKAFINILRDMEQHYVTKNIDARWSDSEKYRIVFQRTGALVILCSVTIPFVSSLSSSVFPSKDVVLSILALIIAAITGLTSFFAWGDAWRSHRLTHIALMRLHSLWELKMIEVLQSNDYENAKETALAETQKILDAVGVRMDSLLEEYFKAAKNTPVPQKANP